MFSIKAEKRSIFGKELAKERLAGRLPVAAYGPKEKSAPLFVDAVEFEKVWKTAGESAVIELEIVGEGVKDSLIHEVEIHPISRKPIHADFYLIEKGKKIEVAIPINFVGVSAAVKAGATLVKVLHELEIEAMPKDLPKAIDVDISVLVGLDSQIHARDIKLPAGVTLVTKEEEVVAAVAEQKEEEVVAAPVDLSAIEVEKKGKKEEEGEGEAAPAK